MAVKTFEEIGQERKVRSFDEIGQKKPRSFEAIGFDFGLPPITDELEPSAEELEKYRKMGVKEYRSVGGTLYDLTEPSTEKEKPIGLLERGVKGFGRSFTNVLQAIETKSRAIGGFGRELEAYDLVQQFKAKTGKSPTADEFLQIYKQAQVNIEAKSAERYKALDVPPPETIPEKATEIGAGLAGFITKLTLTKKALGVPRGSLGGDVVAWEALNLAEGGTPGTGAAFRLMLAATGKIPAVTKTAKIGRVGVESGLFAGLSALRGDDPEIIAMHALIPIAFQAYATTKGRISDAQMVKSWRQQLPFMRDVPTKSSLKMARASRALYEIRNPKHSPKMRQKLAVQWENRFGTSVDKFLKEMDVAFKAAGPPVPEQIEGKIQPPTAVKPTGLAAAPKEGVKPTEGIIAPPKAPQVKPEAITPTEPTPKAEIGRPAAKVEPIKIPEKMTRTTVEAVLSMVDKAYIAKDIGRIAQIKKALSDRIDEALADGRIDDARAAKEIWVGVDQIEFELAKQAPKAEPEAPAAKRPTLVEEKPEELPSDEVLSGVTKRRRTRLIKQTEQDIEESDVYQTQLSGLDARKIEIGYYYVPAKFRSEVEDIIGKKRGPGTKLQQMFTFNPRDKKIVKLQTGKKAEVGPTDWTRAVQEQLGRGKEGIAETEAHLDISDFVERVKAAYESGEKVGRLNAEALEIVKETGDPWIQYKITKLEMMRQGYSAQEIDDMTTEFAQDFDVPLEEFDTEWVGPEPLRLKEIRQMTDEAEKDKALDVLARENIIRRQRDEAKNAVKEVLRANNLEVEVEEIAEIPEAEEYIPFERRGQPTGAAISQADRELVLLAYGADSATGYHEAYHVLRRRLRAKDNAVLNKHFRGDEEAEATAFGEFARTGKAAKSYLKAIWRKLLNLLRKVKSALQGRGFRTVNDIFGEIQTGRIAKEGLRPSAVRYETTTERMVRDSVRSAQIKAEKARLKAMVTPAKKKGPALKRIKIKVRDVTPVLREDLKPLEVPPAMEPPRGGRKPPYFSDEWYKENIKRKKKGWLSRLKSAGRRAFLTGEKILSSSSTRLYNIHPELFRQTRKYIYDVLNRTAVMVDDITPFLKATKKMSRNDRKQLDLALKNSDARKITELVVKYKIQNEYQQARDVLDEIFDAAKEVGIDIEYHRDYWHRHIKDSQGFLDYFQGREDWSIIDEAIKRRAAQAGRKVEELTTDEKAQVVNTLIRGFRTKALTLARPGAAKERTVDVVWSDIDQFYDDFGTSIHKYIKLMNAKIAEREFFGRETKEIQDLRKLQSARLTRLIKLKKRRGPGMPEPKYKEHISKTYENWTAGNERLKRLTTRSPSDTIGGYVYDLVRQGQISPTQEKQIQDILTGIFAPRGMGWGTGLFATGVYIDTLNSPIQALTQLDEFSYSFYRSPLRSIPVAIRTAFRRSKIKPADIGIKSIGVEFQGASMKKALTLLLKSTGFEFVDRLNKENLINTVLSKYQAQARSKKEKPAMVKRLVRVFGKDYKKVLEDLRRPIRSLDDVSDDVKYLLFNDLLDIQPIAITEMPEAYNKSGNLRILYTLKTFYIKRLDYMRNESFKDMKSPKTFVRGFSKLVWLGFSFALFGAGSDFLKDWVKGRAFDLKDSIVDNMLRMVMSSKFQVTQARMKGLGRAVLEQWVPPTKVIDAISKDVMTTAQGKDRGFELWRSVPLVGELYYWWFGRGKEKTEKKRAKGTRRAGRRGVGRRGLR